MRPETADRVTHFPGEWEPSPAKSVTIADRVRPATDDVPRISIERRRKSPVWFKVSFGAASLLGAMLLVMWAQHDPASCALSFEAPRRLHLSRQVDREHLAADGASAARAARRYTSGASGEELQQRLTECEDVLIGSIAATHDVSVDQVRAAAGYVQ